jgi:hypothetical protein
MVGRKHINDLRDGKALSRFIESRIGQPWDKVYSELCSLADHRSKVGQDLLRRLSWNVEKKVIIGDDGNPRFENRWGGLSIHVPYVHPITGILCADPKKKEKPVPKKIEKVLWENSTWFELVTFRTKAKCGCVSFKIPEPKETKKWHSYSSRNLPAVCIHGNEPIPREVWFVVKYGEHDLDEVYKVYTFETCSDYGFRFRRGLKKPGDKYVVYYRDIPDINRRYEIRRKPANHKELAVLRQLLNNSD